MIEFREFEIEMWPTPKVGDTFSVVYESRENWLFEFLRQLKIRHCPRATTTRIHTITKVFPDL